VIATRHQLYCNSEHCQSFFPNEGPVDGAIYSPQDLRIAAQKHGWRQRRNPMRDLCPKCWAKYIDLPRKGGRK
jgi:hypothetical protein